VLVVDDDADIRTLVQTVLVDEGYEVLVAPDGKQALEVVQARQPKVVLLDMNMPVMDGPSFCQALGERHLRARPAIVVMTASNEAPAFRAHCAAADTLGKPFALDELCAVVGRHTA
jgi:CheY-like chemotaxis protein